MMNHTYAELVASQALRHKLPGVTYYCHVGCLMLRVWWVESAGTIVALWPSTRYHHPKSEPIRHIEQVCEGKVTSDDIQVQRAFAMFIRRDVDQTRMTAKCDHRTYSVWLDTIGDTVAAARHAHETGKPSKITVPADAPRYDTATERGKAH